MIVFIPHAKVGYRQAIHRNPGSKECRGFLLAPALSRMQVFHPAAIVRHLAATLRCPVTASCARSGRKKSYRITITMATLLLDRGLVDEIRRIERATGRDDLLSGFVRQLEGNLAGFGAALSDYIARGDAIGPVRAAHTLKGVCQQLGAQALGDLFADIERSAKAGDYAEAKRKFDGSAGLIAQSLEALKHA